MRKNIMFFTLLVVVIWAGLVQAYDFKGIDLQGETITVVSWHDVLKDIERDYPGRIAEAEEKFNCKLEYVGIHWDDYAEGLMNRLLAGDSVYDFWKVNHNFFWELFSQKAFYPVSEIVPAAYYPTLPPPHQSIIDNLSYQGVRYGFSSYGSLLGSMRFVAWNKDMFEREGLPDLYELYRTGQWTWDQALEIAKKTTRDTDGDGNNDQWGWSTVWSFDLGFSNDARLTKEINGQRVFTYDQQPALEALASYYQWQYIDKVVLSGDWGGDNFKAGTVAMQPLEFWRIEFMNKDFNFDFGIVPMPKGPSASRYGYPHVSMETMVLPANSRAAKEIVAVADFLFQAEDYYYGLEKSIAKNVPDRTAVEVVKEGMKSWDGEILMFGAALPDEWSDAFRSIMDGEKTPAAAMAEIKGKVQVNLDQLFDQ
ncbi:MAG: extracellular solute-binding protein [Halanaerobiales bacterium]|nr:extracellular solute-binding protein [Halanaerobiales bacterium]